MPQTPRAADNSPATLRAYILADAALVRGQLKPAQRKEVALAVAKINLSLSSRRARADTAENPSLPGGPLPVARQVAANPAARALPCSTRSRTLSGARSVTRTS